MSEEHELIVLAKKIRWDLDATRAKTSELIRQLSEMDLPEPSQRKCEKCGATLAGKLSLAEHVYLSHEGPEPEHWLRAEELADEPAA